MESKLSKWDKGDFMGFLLPLFEFCCLIQRAKLTGNTSPDRAHEQSFPHFVSFLKFYPFPTLFLSESRLAAFGRGYFLLWVWEKITELWEGIFLCLFLFTKEYCEIFGASFSRWKFDSRENENQIETAFVEFESSDKTKTKLG